MRAIALILLTVATPSWAADVDLRACRAIADKVARLACYDALPLEPGPPPATAGAATRNPVGEFGLAPAAPRNQPEMIESRIEGSFEGWRRNQALSLANGQVWRIVEDSRAVYDLQSPRVTIRRGALGAFYLDIEGVYQTLRVQRER